MYVSELGVPKACKIVLYVYVYSCYYQNIDKLYVLGFSWYLEAEGIHTHKYKSCLNKIQSLNSTNEIYLLWKIFTNKYRRREAEKSIEVLIICSLTSPMKIKWNTSLLYCYAECGEYVYGLCFDSWTIRHPKLPIPQCRT